MAEGLFAAASKVLVIATGLVAMAGECAGSTPLEEDIHAAYVLFASAPDDGATPLPFARLRSMRSWHGMAAGRRRAR